MKLILLLALSFIIFSCSGKIENPYKNLENVNFSKSLSNEIGGRYVSCKNG